MRKEYRNGTLELRGFAELFENGAAVFLKFVYHLYTFVLKCLECV